METNLRELRVVQKMNRAERKAMADNRALEEQAERFNPISGTGATPSMGLSEVRGGKKMMMNASEQGKHLMEHLGALHGAGYAKEFHKGMCGAGFLSTLGHGLSDVAHMFGLGTGGLHTGQYEGEGKGVAFSRDTQDFSGHMKGGFWGALATVGIPLLAKLLGSGKMSQEAHDQVKKMIEAHEQKFHSGKMKGGFLGLAAMALPLIGRMLGMGHMTKGAHDQLAKIIKENEKSYLEGSGRVVGGAKRSDYGKAFSKEEEANMVFEPEDAESMARPPKKSMAKAGMRMMPLPRNPVLQPINPGLAMEGSGFISDLGHGLSDVAHLFGLGKKVKRVVGAGDGRRKRAEVVRKVMAEKGMKMIEASKYVKEHGLYKP